MTLQFLPNPRLLTMSGGFFTLPADRLIVIHSSDPQALLFSAQRIQTALETGTGLRWQINAGWAAPQEQIGLLLRLDSQEISQPQGYRLQIQAAGMQITAHDPAGLFYGACTLTQVLCQAEGNNLPCLDIRDWPDFPVRGVMLDISRDKVPQMGTLLELVERLASWKVNQFQLYTEHTFAYRNHPQPWEQASPMTGEEILALDLFCKQRFIELVPNQNSFGHMERWLKHPRYAPLAEKHGEFKVPWGVMQGPFSLAPLHPGSLELVRGLYDDLLPHFSSRKINVGCDETFDLGQGQSQAACETRGVGRVYLEFVQKIYAEVSRRGYSMQFWGDIINDHPELVPELPKDLTGLLWGYEASHPFDQQGERFAKAGVPFYVCPGTSAWCSLGGRTQNALGNLLNAAENGIKHRACGYLNTDWGDRGHWQVFPVSFLGFAAGAAYAWCLESNRSLDIPAALSHYAFEDRSGSIGKLAYDLGNVYLSLGKIIHNGTPLFWAMQRPMEWIRQQQGITPETLAQTLEAIDQAMNHLRGERMSRPDAALIRREFQNTARLLRHACRRILLALETDSADTSRLRTALKADLDTILPEYKTIWLERNRPGGLVDSVARFEITADAYTS